MLTVFVVRPDHRLPVVSAVAYEHGSREGKAVVWNLSSTGWRLSGDLPLTLGAIFSLIVMLPTNRSISVWAGVVRWVRGEDLGIETLVMDEQARAQLGRYIREQMKAV